MKTPAVLFPLILAACVIPETPRSFVFTGFPPQGKQKKEPGPFDQIRRPGNEPTSQDEENDEEHIRAGGLWVPLLSISPDIDEDEPNQDPGFDAKLENGSGFGIQAGVDGKYGSIRSTFVTAEHRELNRGGRARTGLAIAEMNFIILASDPGPLQTYFEAGGGVGAAWIDFDRNYSDLWGAAGQVQVRFGLNLWDRGSLEAGISGFLLGYPGETIGTGGYFSLAGSLRF